MKQKGIGIMFLGLALLAGGYATAMLSPIIWEWVERTGESIAFTIAQMAMAVALFQENEPGTMGIIALVVAGLFAIVGLGLFRADTVERRIPDDRG